LNPQKYPKMYEKIPKKGPKMRVPVRKNKKRK